MDQNKQAAPDQVTVIPRGKQAQAQQGVLAIQQQQTWDPTQATQLIWLVPWASSAPRRLADHLGIPGG